MTNIFNIANVCIQFQLNLIEVSSSIIRLYVCVRMQALGVWCTIFGVDNVSQHRCSIERASLRFMKACYFDLNGKGDVGVGTAIAVEPVALSLPLTRSMSVRVCKMYSRSQKALPSF